MNAPELEKEMHAKYAQYRARGEWFRMPVDVVNGLGVWWELFGDAQWALPNNVA